MKKIIHHRNQLKHYRNTIHTFKEQFDAVSIDIDFAENLTVPVKFEPQSLHWSHEQITVHSGILKCAGEKSYHPYLSNNKKHDQTFVSITIKEILNEARFEAGSYCIIESDNCTSQYKSAAHFYDLQEIANKNEIAIVRVFGIAGHGKGEVDHIGGLAKVTIRREIASGGLLADAEEMVAFLQNKFESRLNPKYFIKEIDEKELEISRAETKLKRFRTIAGSSSFQVILFRPHSTHIKAAQRLCVCDTCKIEYGSCPLFCEYEIVIQELNKTSLRSDFALEEPVITDEDDDKRVNEFLLPGSICAIAADTKSIDTVWFVKIVCEQDAEEDVVDDYGFRVALGQRYLKGHYVEQSKCTNKGREFKVAHKKVTYFFKESVVYPFVQFELLNNIYFLSNNNLVDILYYVEQNGLDSL